MSIQNVTVLGGGTMGAGIAQVAAESGFITTLFDLSSEILERSANGIHERWSRSVAKGRIEESDAAANKSRLKATTNFADAVATCDYLIEAIPEKLALKQNTFLEAERLAPAHCVFGSNTSTIMISEIAAPLQQRSRVIGIHFFNPVPLMRLIEVVMGPETSEETYDRTLAVAERMKKETVRVRENPGFTTSRINALIGNEAFRMLEEGVASAADIDKALKLGLNHPMGPFEMVDLVGLDARLNNLRYLHEALGESYRPSPLLAKLVEAGRLGKKSGQGVYRYDASGQRTDDGDLSSL